MSKILTLFTGGTIGSVKVYNPYLKQELIMQPSEARKLGYQVGKSSALLFKEYEKRYPHKNHLEDIESNIIMEVLSENMTFDVWNKLITELKTIDFDKYDGIIITHGTDTLGYTANLLALLLANVRIPILLVSSNLVLSDSKANGVENFKGAIDFINNVSLPGVYVPYNNDGHTKIIHGSRITQCTSITNDFNGIYDSSNEKTNSCLGTMDNGNFTILDSDLYRSIIKRTNNDGNLIDKIDKLDSKIIKICPYVGLDYSAVDITKADAILHTLYHSGTICESADLNYNSIHYLIEKAIEYDKPLYFGPLYGEQDKTLYSSTGNIKKGNFLMNLSEESSYMKLLIAYSIAKNQYDKVINEILYNKISEEYIKPYTRIKTNK